MLWFILAFSTAIFESLKDITSKKSLQRVDEYIVGWAVMFFALPLFIPILWVVKIPPLKEDFWWLFLLDGSLNLICLLMYIRALKIADLSLTIPLITFTPLFLLITSPLILHEYPTAIDGLGIFLIVVGSYFLNLKEKEKGWFAPFQAMFVQKGPRLMLIVAMIWSITANVDKLGVRNSSPVFWGMAIYAFMACGLIPIVIYKSKDKLYQIPRYFFSLLPMGLFNGAAVVLQMLAIEMTLVAQVIAVKRMSALISVFLGYLIFREVGIQERSIGAIIMIIGVVIITLW